MSRNSYWLLLISAMLLLSSCGPINRFTRLKKTPREYSLNYCGEEVKAPKTDLNKEAWIVFSDRENSYTLQNPGGKVQFKKIDYLDAFYVIKQKGEYLKLVKYDPSIVEKDLLSRKIKDRKKAQYYGWIHKSRLLLTRQSVTDIKTGFKNKQLVIIKDTTVFGRANQFLATDSIRVFKDPDLTSDNGTIPFYGVVYTLKVSEDKQKHLLARKTVVAPDSIATEVLGWVHSSLVKDVGQRLHVDPLMLRKDPQFVFQSERLNDTLVIPDAKLETGIRFGKKHPSLKYNPVISYVHKDSTVSYKTGFHVPVVNQTKNYVFNVNGNKIKYAEFKELEDHLKRINLLFVFEGKEQVVQKYDELINVIQNLQTLFEDEKDSFSYRFGAVIATRGQMERTKDDKWREISSEIRSSGMTDKYTDLLNFLIKQTEDGKRIRPTTYTWEAVKTAVELAESDKNATNILVIIGEDGQTEKADSSLVKRMADANCRLLGYQLHSKTTNQGNNFVLQIENMIDVSAQNESLIKREKIVYPDQLKAVNNYREVAKNIYALDFPERSMTQGWLIFPEKSIHLPYNILADCVDSLVAEVKWDNENLTNSLYKAFNTVGTHNNEYDSLLVEYHNMKPAGMLSKDFQKHFSKEFPAWHIPTMKVDIDEDTDRNLNYHLLLSKEELDDVREFVRRLSLYEVDYKYKGKNKKSKKHCNCPDDEPVVEPIYYHPDSLMSHPGYRSTRKLRKELQRSYYSELKYCKLCKTKFKVIKRYTLAEAQQKIVGSPTYGPYLEYYKLGKIKEKKHIANLDLDELVIYFKQKKEALDIYLMNPDKFESNGQAYYWIDQKLLP